MECQTRRHASHIQSPRGALEKACVDANDLEIDGCIDIAARMQVCPWKPQGTFVRWPGSSAGPCYFSNFEILPQALKYAIAREQGPSTEMKRWRLEGHISFVSEKCLGAPTHLRRF